MVRATRFLLAAGLALAGVSPASAAVTICLGGGCAGGNPLSQVQFTSGQSGTSIDATLNNAPGTVTFSSLETLKTHGNGQASLMALDGVLDNPLTITYADGLISKLELSLDAGVTGNISFSFLGGDSDGVTLAPYALGNSANVYNALNGTFKSVTVSFLNSATVKDVKQVRVTAAPVASAVPEPATWALMLLGFGAVGASLRVRNRKAKPALA